MFLQRCTLPRVYEAAHDLKIKLAANLWLVVLSTCMLVCMRMRLRQRESIRNIGKHNCLLHDHLRVLRNGMSQSCIDTAATLRQHATQVSVHDLKFRTCKSTDIIDSDLRIAWLIDSSLQSATRSAPSASEVGLRICTDACLRDLVSPCLITDVPTEGFGWASIRTS